MFAAFWYAVDSLLHRLGVPSRWVCDRFDLSLGVKPEEL